MSYRLAAFNFNGFGDADILFALLGRAGIGSNNGLEGLRILAARASPEGCVLIKTEPDGLRRPGGAIPIVNNWWNGSHHPAPGAACSWWVTADPGQIYDRPNFERGIAYLAGEMASTAPARKALGRSLKPLPLP